MTPIIADPALRSDALRFTVSQEGGVYRLTLADGRTGLFKAERDAYDDAARLLQAQNARAQSAKRRIQ